MNNFGSALFASIGILAMSSVAGLAIQSRDYATAGVLIGGMLISLVMLNNFVSHK